MESDEGTPLVEMSGGEEGGGRRVGVRVDGDEGLKEMGWKAMKELEELDRFLRRETKEQRRSARLLISACC